MQVDAVLCDAASVREGLLFVMSGGITRARRSAFPAKFHGAIAMMVTVSKAEARRDIGLSVSFGRKKRDLEVLGEGTSRIAFGDLGRFGRGEPVVVPLALDVEAEFPEPGRYQFVVKVGSIVRTLTITSVLPDEDLDT